jgi:hypothetical protein
MNDTVRETRRADELKPGDWLFEDENGAINPNEVMAAFEYPTKHGVRVHLTTQVPGRDPYSVALEPGVTLELATEAEVAALREQAERAQKIADIRAYANWLESNPAEPVGYGMGGQVDVEADSEAEAVAKVRAFAVQYGAEVRDALDDRTSARLRLGSVEHVVIAWHKDGRPTEPAPEPRPDFVDGPCADSGCPNASWPHLASSDLAESEAEEAGLVEHYETSGWTGGDGGSGVACACGVQFDNFDSLAEAGAQLKRHIADANT